MVKYQVRLAFGIKTVFTVIKNTFFEIMSNFKIYREAINN